MMRSVIVLLALLAFASAQFVSGTYTSNYGAPNAPWYICVVGDQFYATYSRIGMGEALQLILTVGRICCWYHH